MRHTTYLLIALALVIFIACGKTQQYTNLQIVEEFPRNLKLTSTVFEEDTNYNIIYLADTILIAQTHQNGLGCLFLYNAISGEYLGPLARKGRGPGEFIYMDMNGSDYRVEPDGIKIWVYDPTEGTYSKINLTRRLAENEVVVEQKLKLPEGTTAATMFNDTLLLLKMRVGEDNIRDYALYDTVSKEMKTLDLINEKDYKSKDYAKYNPAPYIISSDADTNRLMINFGFQNRFKIMDIDGGNEINISVYDGPVSVKQIIGGPIDNIRYYYYSYCTKNHIYGVYFAASTNDIMNGRAGTPEIHIFTTDGEPVACLNVDKGICYIAVNEEERMLWGLTVDGMIYSYSLSELFD